MTVCQILSAPDVITSIKGLTSTMNHAKVSQSDHSYVFLKHYESLFPMPVLKIFNYHFADLFILLITFSCMHNSQTHFIQMLDVTTCRVRVDQRSHLCGL